VGGSFNLSSLRAVAEGFAHRYLSDYTAGLRNLRPKYGRKEINDPIWGTIVLNPIEVAILDSPLLQRLRFIRQLGVAHWIYPGAIHTRFDHTLGVLFQVQQLVTALNASAKADRPNDAPLIGSNETQLLRMCALLHDTGHFAFSHVSEKAVEELPEFTTLSKAFSDELATSDPGEDKQLSEMLVYYIVRSPAMRNLLRILVTQYGPSLHFDDDHERNLEAIIDKASRALIGRKIDDRRPLLHELISGPYDADKLDYLVRDVRFAGIPSVLDIPRLLQKLAAHPMLASDLPQAIGGQLMLSADETVWLFGIRTSGAAVLDELQLARVLAHSKIYRHPKVIAVEQMVRAFVEAVAQLVSSEQLLAFMYTNADDALLGISRAALREALKLDLTSVEAAADELLTSAEETLSDTRDRRLWVRAFQFSMAYLSPREGDEVAEKLELFREELDHPQKRERFVTMVRDEVHRILTLAGEADPPSRVALNSAVMIRVLHVTSGQTQIGRAFLLQKSEPPRQLSTQIKARGSWVEQYMSDQPRAYIFSKPKYANDVFIAVEKLLRTEYGVRLPGWAKEASKRDSDALLNRKRHLASTGYWQRTPYDIRPKPERLERPDVQNRIANFDQLRSAFQEPKGAQAGEIPNNLRTMAWLRQFDTTDHVECALYLLDHFKILTRKDTGIALRAFIDANAKFRHAWVVPFGDVKDSSTLQAYFATDLDAEYVERQDSLENYVKYGAGKPLIFIDDFTGSGGQATDILAAWFDRADLRRPLNERREALPPEVLKRLADGPVAFVFVAGWNEGSEAISRTCEQIGLEATVYCHLRDDDLPYARDCLLAKMPGEKVASFLERCDEIGNELLRSTTTDVPPDEEKMKSRALGYGGRGLLLASTVNVPTQTLTAIWKSGKADGVEWTPLLLRRKKS
jgi:HD superfamily phosphohydrolase